MRGPGGLIADLAIRMSADVTPMERELRRVNQTLGQQERSVMQFAQRHRRAFTIAGTAAVAFGTALAAGLKRAGDAAREFETSQTRMITQVGLSRAEVDELGKAALGLGETGRGPTELSESLFFLTSAGLRGQEALDAVEMSAKASAIGLGETKLVADLVSSALNSYGDDVLSAEQATDVLVGTVREGKAEAPELAGALGGILPIASEMGVEFHEVGAALAAMTRTGSSASEAGTQLQAILSSMLRPTGQSAEALAEFGLSAEGLRATIREDGLWAALMAVREAVGDNQEAMGAILPNIRALKGFMDLTGASADETGQIFARLEDTTGLLSEGFEEWGDTAEAAAARQSAAWEAFRIQLGQAVLPVMSEVTEATTGLLERFNELPESGQRAIGTAGMIASALAIVGGAALILLPRIADTVDALKRMGVNAEVAKNGLRGMGRLLGWAGLAFAAAQALDAIGDALVRWRHGPVESVDSLEASLVALNDTGQISGALFRAYDADLERLGEQARIVASRLDANFLTDNWLTRAFDPDLERAREEIEALDRALVGLMQTDPNAAAGAFADLAGRLLDMGVPAGELARIFPEFAMALDDAAARGESAVGNFAALRAELTNARTALELLSPGIADLSDRWEINAAAADTTAMSVEEAALTLGSAAGPTKEAADALEVLRSELAGNADALGDLPPEVQALAHEMGLLEEQTDELTETQEAFRKPLTCMRAPYADLEAE